MHGHDTPEPLKHYITLHNQRHNHDTYRSGHCRIMTFSGNNNITSLDLHIIKTHKHTHILTIPSLPTAQWCSSIVATGVTMMVHLLSLFCPVLLYSFGGRTLLIAVTIAATVTTNQIIGSRRQRSDCCAMLLTVIFSQPMLAVTKENIHEQVTTR